MHPNTTPRLYNPAPLAAHAAIALDEDQAHYLLHVLRLNDGDVVRLFNARDGEWRGAVKKSGKRGVAITLDEQTRTAQVERDLWLCPAPIKKAHFDYMIEKATELGVSAIHPALTARTQIRDVNVDRCRAMATESAEQSERLSVPEIHKPVTLKALIDTWPSNRLMIVCAEWGDAVSVRDCFAALKTDAVTKASIVTGPEGGFAKEELEALHHIKSAHFVRLGSRILRADSAAIAALSVWQAICGDWT